MITRLNLTTLPSYQYQSDREMAANIDGERSSTEKQHVEDEMPSSHAPLRRHDSWDMESSIIHADKSKVLQFVIS